MTVTLELNTEEAQKIESIAKERGKTVQQALQEIIAALEIEPTSPNEEGLVMLQAMLERQQGRPYTSHARSMSLLKEARTGAMYGYERTE